MQFEGFIFDLDGTLIEYRIPNPAQLFEYEWWKMLGYDDEKAGALSEIRDREERTSFLGITEKEYVEKYLPAYAPVDAELRKKLLDNGKLILREGAIELLESINKPKALVSQSPKEGVEITLKNLGLKKYFDFIHYRDFNASFGNELRKPRKELAQMVCRELGLKPNKKIAMVGDGKRDVEFAENAGFTSILVYNDEAKANYSFKNLKELKEWLRL